MECVAGARHAVRWIVITALLFNTAAHAQTVRSAHGTQQRPYIPPARQPHNSMARDTTPFNCEQYRHHPHSGMAGYCQGIENMALHNEARRQGRPAPSASIIELPPLGSEPAKTRRQASLHNFGNITLLTLPLNNSVGNGLFAHAASTYIPVKRFCLRKVHC